MYSQFTDQLIEILGQIEKIYIVLLNASKSKKDIIIKGKAAELEEIVKQEHALILEAGKLETIREELIVKISGVLSIEPSAATITELVKHSDARQAKRLESLRQSIGNTINELKDVNNINSSLIKNSLDYIEFSINLIAGTGASCNNYQRSGNVSSAKKRNFFDMKL